MQHGENAVSVDWVVLKQQLKKRGLSLIRYSMRLDRKFGRHSESITISIQVHVSEGQFNRKELLGCPRVFGFSLRHDNAGSRAEQFIEIFSIPGDRVGAGGKLTIELTGKGKSGSSQSKV